LSTVRCFFFTERIEQRTMSR